MLETILANTSSITLYSELTIAISMIGFALLCELVPRLVSEYNSNGFTSIIRSNFGKDCFSWQKVFFVVYHQSNPCWWAHVLTFEVDFFLQYIIACHYGFETAVFYLLAFQAATFSQFQLWLATMTHWSIVSYIVTASPYASFIQESVYPWCAFLMLVTSSIRSLSHAWEQLPPIMSGVNKFTPAPINNFHAYTLWYSFRGYIVGTLSEMYAGLLHRLHYCVLSFCLDCGVLAKDQTAALKVLEDGFSVDDLETQLNELTTSVSSKKKFTEKKPESSGSHA